MEKKKVWWGGVQLDALGFFFIGKQNFCGRIARTFPSYAHSSVFLVVLKLRKALEIEGSGLFWVCDIFEIHDSCEGSRNSMQVLRLQEVESPRFPDNLQTKVLMFSVLRTSCLYPSGKIPGTHFCQKLSRLHGRNAAGGISVSPLRIEPVAFRLVAQCLNQLIHHFFVLYKLFIQNNLRNLKRL